MTCRVRGRSNFPAYERVIPKTNDKQIEFDRDRLSSALRRVRLLSNEPWKRVRRPRLGF